MCAFHQPPVWRWCFHLKVARATLCHFQVTPAFAPHCASRRVQIHPSDNGNRDSLSVTFALAFPIPHFTISHFSFLDIFSFNLCDASDESWLPFSSFLWHPISEWPWRCTALGAHTHQMHLWSQEKPSNFSSRFSSDGVKFKMNRE